MRCQGAGHQGIDLGLVAHVAMQVQAAQFAGQRGAAQVVNVGHHDARAFPREAANAGLANALRATCDDADTAGQAEGDVGCVDVHGGMVAAPALKTLLARVEGAFGMNGSKKTGKESRWPLACWMPPGGSSAGEGAGLIGP